MQVLDKLIAGIPQSIEDPEVLLGLGSWHLYPDMAVVHNKAKHVCQKDELVAPGGVMTIGLRGPWQKDAQGILWSLPLSYLRYYGRPVPSKRELGICTSRITFEQFLFLSLGSLTKGWPDGPEKVVQFLFALSHAWQKWQTAMPAWLRLFLENAQWYKSLSDTEKEQWQQIFFFGRRRCKTLFGASAPEVPIGFGMCDVNLFLKALPNAESRVAWLRKILASPNIVRKLPQNAIIRYEPELENGSSIQRQPTCAMRREECPCGKRVEGDSQSGPGQAGGLPHCASEFHNHHPDARPPSESVEFATVYPSSVAGRPISHKRWIPANANSRKPCNLHGHQPEYIRPDIQQQDDQCFWQIKGFDSPSTASVLRAESLSEQTKEDCGLYHLSAEYEFYHIRLAPALDPICAWTFEQVRSKGLAVADPKCCLKCGNEIDSEGDSPGFLKQKHRTSYTAGCCSKWYIPWAESCLSKGQLPGRPVYVALGELHTAALCLPTTPEDPTAASNYLQLPQTLDIDHVIYSLEQDILSAESVSNYSNSVMYSLKGSFDALLGVADIYRNLPDSTIDIGVTSKPLGNAKWRAKRRLAGMKLACNFSCIAMFESGGIDVDPSELMDVIAISSGNSLHIAECCLRDPWHEESEGRILHTVGNVGKPGMCFLISPKAPLVREPERDKWQLVRHAPFNGKLESNLTDTTLHLSFTGYEFPLRTLDHGAFDKAASFVEAVVRAFDRREWVADIDILAAFSLEKKKFLAGRVLACGHSEDDRKGYEHLNLTSVDSWIEFLDAPETAFVVRAKDDWISKLAVFAIAMQANCPVVLMSDHVCWKCVEDIAETLSRYIPGIERSMKLMILC
jgi:hypothetical protein